MTAPRIVVRGATLALSRRTTCRKAFLAPWHEQVEACWLYALADAQRKHGVAVHHAVRVVTHHHLSITLREESLGAFLRDFHRDVSRSLAALLTKERYDTQRDIFDGRSTHVMRLLDASAQARHLLYEYLNPVAAGLVAHPEHMPGRVLQFRHWKRGGLVVKRPPFYFRKDRPEALHLELTPPPLLYQAFDGDLEALVHHMERLGEEGRRALRDARRRPALGAQRLRRMHPWQEPTTLASPGGQPVPTFVVGADGQLGRTQRARAALETKGFRLAHHEARGRFLEGDLEVAFPHGTYGARLLYGARVAEPESDAYVCRPGPLLEEVRDGITERAKVSEKAPQAPLTRQALANAVKASWRREALETVEAEDLGFPHRNSASPSQEAGNDTSRPEPVDVSRAGWRSQERELHPRRLITRRDRRRGRPWKKSGSDPPV